MIDLLSPDRTAPRRTGLSGRLARAVAVVSFLAASALPAAAAEVQRVVSDGGIVAWLVEDDAVPLVAVDFAFDGGAAQDPKDRPGVANMLSTLLDEGAGELESAAFQQKLEEEAVRLSFSAGRDAFNGSLRLISDRKEVAFELLALALNQPRFDADPIERMRAQLISGINRDATDPEAIASRLWSTSVFGDHPYARPVDGTAETVAAITREDIADYHRRTFARSNLVVGVVGAISAEELKPLLDQAFGPLPAEAELVDVPEATPTFGATETAALPNPQTTIRVGTIGLKRHDPDYMAAYVMNHILGGGSFSSRLYREVRETRGLAYSVWSAVVPYSYAGVFLGGTATRADRAGETLEILTGEFKRMAEEGPTEQELADAKRFLTGSYALRFDGSGKIAAQLVALQLDELPIDYFNTRNAQIEALTLDDVKRAASRVLGEAPLTVVTVGPTSS